MFEYFFIINNTNNFSNYNNNILDSQNTFSNINNNDYYYYLEETKNLNIPALKELDEKISLLRKEINSLDIMENLAEQANLLCVKEMNYNIDNNNNNNNENNNITDEEIFKQIEETNKDFYEEIESKLQMAEEALTYQNINNNNDNENDN